MGNVGAKAFGLEEAPITLEGSSKSTAYIVSHAKWMEVFYLLNNEDRPCYQEGPFGEVLQ